MAVVVTVWVVVVEEETAVKSTAVAADVNQNKKKLKCGFIVF